MKVRVLSDLHIENSPYEIKYGGEDILVLAGDVSPDCNEVVKLMTDYLSQNDKVLLLFVIGNHDYYDKTIPETIKFYETLEISRLHFLQDSSIVIQGIRFYGATMWTDLIGMEDFLAAYAILDYSRIKQFSPALCKTLHHTSRKKLMSTLDLSPEPVVVITHHLPSYKSIHPKFHGQPANPAFASCLDDLVQMSKLFIHGHTHCSVDYKIGDTRVVCNPRGTVWKGVVENEEFQDNFVIEIN